jgi:hypothetical protein
VTCLTMHHVQGTLEQSVGSSPQAQDLHTVADRRERIPELVCEHREKLILGLSEILCLSRLH